MDDFLTRLLKTLGLASALAALPLFVALIDLQPPWPPAIAYVSSALVLLAALATWEWNKSGIMRRRRLWLGLAITLTVCGLLGYLTLYSLFVEQISGTSLRVIRGFVCTQQAIEVYPHECPDLPREALRGAEWEAVVLWTRSSVTIVRISMTALWFVFTAGLVCGVSAVVAGERSKMKRRK